MDRLAALGRIESRDDPWDIAVIGGGATGVGITVDAASRGYSVCLLEQCDFGKGTSSRSTKLIHGGVRYLQQGNIALVLESLRERGILRQNAPHLVHDLAFVVPNYSWWEAPFYGIGMRVYDMLAGRYGFGQSRILSIDEVLERIPTLDREGLRGGVLYYDGQFDDSRLLIDLAQTAELQGATLVNYAPMTGLTHDAERFVNGLTFTDIETGKHHEICARCVINATGPFCDAIRRLDEPDAQAMIAPSQGVHIVLDKSFLPGDAAIMVPRTSDGRVMFAIPWHEHTLIGTTDTLIPAPSLEPIAMPDEITFLIETAGQYLSKRPTRADILSVFAGIRPLVRAKKSARTPSLNREHTIHVSDSGLLTIAGGKWTTYRKMAEDCVDHAAMLAKLPEKPCVTKSLKIHQSPADSMKGLAEESLPSLVSLAVKHEMARTVEDVLARRTRALFLNARAAIKMAPKVAELMSMESGRDLHWRNEQVAAFNTIASNYLVDSNG